MGWHVLFSGKTIVKDTNQTSSNVHLWDGRNVHSLQYEITGDGTLDLEVYTSVDGASWISNGIKADNVVKTSGPDSDGKDIIPLSLKPGDHLKVKATEVVTTDDAVLTLWFVQK